MNKKRSEKDSVGKNGGRIIPLGDRVLLKELSAEERHERTASGIYIPDTVSQDKGAKEGRVVAVGEGRLEDGKKIPVSVRIGDKVLYQWGDSVKIGNEEFTVVTEGNILAIIR